MMDHRLTALEKAFELARSGECPSLGYLMKRLKGEGFDSTQIQGKSLRQQLKQLIEKTKSAD
jgi:hypothetical protein